MRCTMQEIFQRHFAAYAQQRTLHPREQRAAACISQCYTGALGAHVLRCPLGHFEQWQLHACRHRSCPRCAEQPRQQWLQAQLEQLLPCPHFHVIFTLPHVLLALWEFNRSRLAQLLFDCARQALLQLLVDARHLGAVPGLLMALHTWGRTLSHHPHLHCLVSAGGLGAQDRWVPCRDEFLLPLKPLQRLFAGKLLARLGQALASQQLRCPPEQPSAHWRALLRTLYRQHWNIQINPPYAHGRGVALYLARYVKGGPLPARRALALHDAQVHLPYTDHRDGQPKTLQLAATEFIARVLWHAPPRGQHMVRRAGLYASALGGQHRRCVQLLSAPDLPPEPQASAWHEGLRRPDADPMGPRCPQCQAPLQRSLMARDMHHRGEVSNQPSPPPCRPGPTRRSSGQARASPSLAT